MERIPGWFRNVVAATVLFLLNVIVIWPWFSLEYPAEYSSIEGAFIGIARHVREQFGHQPWFPYWYGGIPFPNTYPPLSHLLTASWSWTSGNSVALSYHQVSGVVFAFIPPAVFGLGLALRAERVPSFLAGLFVSLASPSGWLTSPIANDMGGWRFLRRFQVLAVYGEHPNLTSVLFCLLALTFLALALFRPRVLWGVLAVLACAATALSNWLGAVTLATGAVALLLSQERVTEFRGWLRFGLIAAAAYALASPWMPPSTIAAVRRNAPFVGGRYEPSPFTALYILAGILLLLVLVWALRAMGTNRSVRFAALWTYFLAGIVLLSAKRDIQLLPQAMRYHVAMELAFGMLLVLGGFWFVAEACCRPRLAFAFLGVVLGFSVVQVPVAMRYAHSLVQPGDGSTSVEARTARWVAEQLPGQRVFLPGSVSFWADAFASVPQLGGGFDNGIQNPVNMGVTYQIYSSDGAGEHDGEIAVTWLKAYGTRAVAVSLPDSPEYYHPFRNPAKFEGLLEKIWEHRGMRIYAVPSRHEGLAFVVPETALPRSRPANGLDVAEAERYVAALEDTRLPVTRFHWTSLSEATVEAEVRDGEAVSVQIAHHPGWEAWSDGKPLNVAEDGLGQIALRSGAGKHRIQLRFTGGWEQLLAKSASLLSALLLAGLLVPPLRKKAAALPAMRTLARRL